MTALLARTISAIRTLDVITTLRHAMIITRAQQIHATTPPAANLLLSHAILETCANKHLVILHLDANMLTFRRLAMTTTHARLIVAATGQVVSTRLFHVMMGWLAL
jgi:hypothetical protein